MLSSSKPAFVERRKTTSLKTTARDAKKTPALSYAYVVVANSSGIKFMRMKDVITQGESWGSQNRVRHKLHK